MKNKGEIQGLLSTGLFCVNKEDAKGLRNVLKNIKTILDQEEK